MSEIDEIVDEARRASLAGDAVAAEVLSFDGAPLKAYALGKRRDRAVVLASACGMPVELCEPWMRRLAEDYLVVTWESRGLFDGGLDSAEGFDRQAQHLDAQAADLLAVMDHFGVAGGHLMGLCGGAMIVLAAAMAHSERATSLSLWYGDYELGLRCPKTSYQKDLKDFLSMAAEDRSLATSLRSVFCRSLLNTPLPDLAHLTLYPYANDELLYRYARLSNGIMARDVTPQLGKVAQKTLVVTSQDDTKAHPEGSRLVAADLPKATLHVEPHGDHITLFHAEPAITELAVRFIAEAGI
jgi:pimeloyl-ACP methyl ester carboxylesterase